MYDFDGILDRKDVNIRYKKVQVDEGKWLYSFRDESRASKERSDYLKNRKKKNDYDLENYEKKDQLFGTVVYESNKDFSPKAAYDAYAKRWEIELMFKMYKDILELTTVRVHGDYSVIGTEFINFLSTILTCKARNTFDEKDLFEKYSYRQLMGLLKKQKVVRFSQDEPWQTTRTVKYIEEILQGLNIPQGCIV